MRDLTSGMQLEVLEGTVRPAWLVRMVFDSGTLYVWSGEGDLEWGGNTYTGVGHLGSISDIVETSELRAEGIALTLTGIPSANIGLALADARQGKEVDVWFALLGADLVPVEDPFLAFSGFTDVPTIEDGPEYSTITFTCESRLIDLERPRHRRYTNEDQQSDYPGDRGFEHVAHVAGGGLVWGELQLGIGNQSSWEDRHP